MDRYPDYRTYRALYARYYVHSSDNLLSQLMPLTGMNVMDLCGGDGRLTIKMLEADPAKISLVDAEKDMVPSYLTFKERLSIHIEPVAFALNNFIRKHYFFDRVVCQQAINYWLDTNTAKDVSDVLRPGGIFVFNTFHQKPSAKQRILEYELDGHSFVEVSWLVGNTIHHLQTRDGLAPHYTKFSWISPERLQSLLSRYFIINETRTRNTSLYRCEKK